MDAIKKMLDTMVTIGSYKMKIVYLVSILFLIWIIFGHVLCSCCRINVFEGFNESMKLKEKVKVKNLKILKKDKGLSEGFANNSNATFGPNYLTSSDSTFVVDPSKWSYSGGATLPATKPNYKGLGQDQGLNYIIENMKFAPECCPSAYSSSQGCACMSDDTINFLSARGGNN